MVCPTEQPEIDLTRLRKLRGQIAATEHIQMAFFFSAPDAQINDEGEAVDGWACNTLSEAIGNLAIEPEDCGTAMCVAGTCQYYNADRESEEELGLDAEAFTKNWLTNTDYLYLPCQANKILGRLFLSSALYGRDSLERVTKRDVLWVMDKLIQQYHPDMTVTEFTEKCGMNYQG